ncbi:MAG TPA: FHA domain-containing protein [Gemmataceae bacterium]|nr:FHA domain-containing protein [Gemmataceae bacterium]
MSFRLFIYYCALCGGGGAFLGWMLGRPINLSNGILTQGCKGMLLGLSVAWALGLVDALWMFSLRRLLSIGLRVATAMVVGSVGGLLGGLVSQALYGWKEHAAFLVFGWTITGFLIGVSLGVFDLLAGLMRGRDTGAALRKILKGVLGGTLGGIAGGILSLLLLDGWSRLLALLGGNLQVEDRLWSPSAWGFVALGVCIGLLIGLAQVILKEAWLKVEAGFRKGREVILAKAETTIGRSESCDIGLFGDPQIERLHARIRREDNRYVLIDEGAGTYVNDALIHGSRILRSGDAIRMGNCVLRFGERQKQTQG